MATRHQHLLIFPALLLLLLPQSAALAVAIARSVRSAAAPGCRTAVVMAMPRRNFAPRTKPVVDTTPHNEQIQFESMRVVLDVPGGADELLGVMSKAEALAAAEERDLDLVLIGPKSDPPVCKIVSYDKFRFLKEKKKKEQQKAVKGQELKELKMSYKIGEHDYDVRKRAAEKFLGQGNKVKFSILFKGREITHADVGKTVMERMAQSLEAVGSVDSPPRVREASNTLRTNVFLKLSQAARGPLP